MLYDKAFMFFLFGFFLSFGLEHFKKIFWVFWKWGGEGVACAGGGAGGFDKGVGEWWTFAVGI